MQPHNQFLRVAFAMGIPGLLVFLSVWGVVIAWCGLWIYRAAGVYPLEEGLLWGIIAALCGSMASGLFQGQFFDGEVQTNILMWMGMGLYIGLYLRKELYSGPLIAG